MDQSYPRCPQPSPGWPTSSHPTQSKVYLKTELSVEVKHLQRDLGLQIILTHGHLENAILGTLSLRGVCVCMYMCVCPLPLKQNAFINVCGI